jgi:hypothetical protein
MTDVRDQMSEDRCQRTDVREQKTDSRRQRKDDKALECGLRPVRAIGAYAPEGSGNILREECVLLRA